MDVVHNSGAALGIVDGPPTLLIMAALVALVVFGAVVIPLGVRAGAPAWVPALVIGGSASNIVDRFRFEGVRDFIATPWGMFNLADLSVLAGVALVAVIITRQSLASATTPIRAPRRYLR